MIKIEETDTEEEIKDYLTRNKIERLTKSEVDENMRKKYNETDRGGVELEDFINSHKNYPPIEEIPEFYDIAESDMREYDYRVAFLKSMTKLIDSFPRDDYVLMDSGCATALDLCFLAERYSNGKNHFRGYDHQEDMIRLAMERVERLNLKCVEFEESSHDSPGDSEISSADILYNNSSLGFTSSSIKEKTDEEIAIRVVNVFSRIKPGGIGVIGGTRQKDPSFLNPYIRGEGIEYKESNWVFDRLPGKGLYNHFFNITRPIAPRT